VPPGQQRFEDEKVIVRHQIWNRRIASPYVIASARLAKELQMKKIVLALSAVAAFTGSALAADLPARTYTKAPEMAPVASWTGFYIFGGAGGGVWDANSNAVSQSSGAAVSRNEKFGGDGWFGTVGAGYDWQLNSSWVFGILADGQFGDIRGSISDPFSGNEGRESLRTSYAAGVRVGYLVAPNVLSYVNAGYSGSQWSGATHTPLFTPASSTFTTPSFNRDGFFIGGGVENNLNIFGISAPGWFMKTEYRAAYYGRVTLPETFVGSGAPTPDSLTFKPLVQTISTSLVYRFNWTGAPVVAKY
jgi:outer membrane immunogenic protein